MILSVIDTETTGFDMLRHEIIEIGVVKVDTRNGKFRVIDAYDAKIKPQHIEYAHPQALKINGYTEEGWRDALDFREVADRVSKMIETSDFHLGQNLVFDYRFITKAYAQHNIALPAFKKYIDTKLMADSLVHDGKLARSGLDFLCEHYKIPTQGRAHTALTDCKRTLKLYQKLAKEVQPAFLEFSKPYDPHGGKV